eukprot:3398172-Pleurochrysis_carterae.AAC.1
MPLRTNAHTEMSVNIYQKTHARRCSLHENSCLLLNASVHMRTLSACSRTCSVRAYEIYE